MGEEPPFSRNLFAVARFRFKVADAAGKVRSGVMTAPDLESARRTAQANGFKVLELTPVAERGRGASYRPGPGERFESWERSRAWRGVFLLLAVLGLAWAVASGVRSGAAGSKAKMSPTIKLHLSGTVGVPEGQRENALLIFYFPEVPMTVSRRLVDVSDGSGKYSVDLEFEAVRKPAHFSLTLVVDGKPLAQTPQRALTGDPLQGKADL